VRRPTLYKHRGKWYVRLWDTEKLKYYSRSLGIIVEGKKERRREAEDAARKLSDEVNQAQAAAVRQNHVADTPLL